MQFNSLAYLLFLPVVAFLYFVLPARLKNPLLLGASYFFYMNWNAVYALLMLASTVMTYACGLLIGKADSQRVKRWAVGICFALNLGILFFFKYFHFTSDTIRELARVLFEIDLRRPTLEVLLPVGISFYTFQALGYTVDVYRGKLTPVRNFFQYALFVSFFPQLVAGPIERSTHLLDQFSRTYRFDYERMRSGVLLIGWGLFKKMVVADRLAIVTNQVYGEIRAYSGVTLLVATLCFAFQIYCDFSAYSDIARGSARILGISLMKNFRTPYLSRSIREFWQRWHISLSSWFRDYLYIPLGGSRHGTARKYVNLMIVFLVSGLWHGAAMTFVLWGLLNGLYQVVGALSQPIRTRVRSGLGIAEHSVSHRVTQVAITFALTLTAWVFFRADSIGDALYGVTHLWIPTLWQLTDGSLLKLGLGLPELLVGLLSVCLVMGVEWLAQRKDLPGILFRQPLIYRWALYLCLVFGILVFGSYGMGYAEQSFLYFQF